ncbi:MAG: L-lactate permease [Bifidobacteriaceae bacterium]|jgi:lactate permease|nr:L-lactate permease [Bifidobacteriaceae bacterium]MCI1915093.1 L-lactate permease [Bifidobacteriaceae bacterium]
MFSLQNFIPTANAVGGSVPLSALIALVPLVLFFVLLGVFKTPTHWCAVISLVAAIAIAIFGFHMPWDMSLNAGLQGAVFGVFPILYIVIMAVWLYNLTDTSGRSKDVQAIFSAVGKGDKRVQAILIGFCFCGLMEGLAGFGAPVAISCAMLLAIGIKPLKAGLAAMVGNGITVGFGAMAIPVTTVARLGGDVPAAAVGATMGRISPFIAIWVPVLLLVIVDGWRGVRQVWPAALAAGTGMALGYFLGANYISYELAAVLASLLSLLFVVILMRFWQPKHTPQDQASAPNAEKISASRGFLGLFPYLLVVVILAITKLVKPLAGFLASLDVSFGWPGLDGRLLDSSGAVSTSTQFSFNWASSPGTMLLITGVIVAIVYGATGRKEQYSYTFGKGMKTLGTTIYNLRITILTIAVIMALAYVMNFSGQTNAIGTALAATGSAFAFLSPVLGWIGTAVTGSATSSAALFGNLQATAAQTAGIHPHLLLGVNEIGGGLGKIVSPQNLSIAAAAIQEPGSESKLLIGGAKYSLIMLAVLSVITFLASSGIFGWIIVS